MLGAFGIVPSECLITVSIAESDKFLVRVSCLDPNLNGQYVQLAGIGRRVVWDSELDYVVAVMSFNQFPTQLGSWY